MQSELKPCPFCGCSDIRINIHRSTAPHHHGETAYSIGCYQCGGSVPSRYDRSLLISFWNARASDAEITRLTEALRAAEEEKKALREALEEISDLPGEINPSNYDHDDACELNRQFCYGLLIASQALAGAKP